MSIRSRFKGSKYWALQSSRIIYDFKFDPIKAYLESTEEMILQQEKKLAEKYNKWNEKHGNKPEMPSAFDVYEMDILNSSEFPNILNQSVYLTIYSTFENEFFKLCEWCRRAENIKIGPKDIKDLNYIGQCRKFVMKVLDVNLDNLNEKWAEIRKYQIIRNSIAHNNGVIKSANQDILNFINSSNGISFDMEESRIKIESIEFLKTLINKLTDFLSETAEQIIERKDSTRK
ncbi:hypothetical protein [Flagellimonas profundi]|uniref:RiboL-PSP-HEPN domain-containing protein n=1 Tax=Flagellimonas profundi TaxID=2915620 RepID=A0ABS3FEN4_9FLAO|nr:hypothetical protein [Allomuricauda profundi]MBO0341051.1 hypothetical protein [Allomuricauda profundi]